MKKFLNKELYKINKILNETDKKDDKYIKALKTQNEVKKILNSEDDIIDDYSFVNLKPIYNEIIKLVKTYSEMSLLETELPIDYPMLKTRKKIDNEAIINFINNVYSEELPEYNRPTLSLKNLKVFNLPFFKRIINNGKCVIYHQYYEGQTIILLNSYNNINDLIRTTSNSVETFIYKDSMGKVNLLEYYMKNRALSKLKDSSYHKDCIDLELISRDSLILTARILKNLLEDDFDNLDNETKLVLQDFINNALAIELSKNPNITLNDLIGNIYSDILLRIHEIDMNNLCYSENEILNNLKILTK